MRLCGRSVGRDSQLDFGEGESVRLWGGRLGGIGSIINLQHPVVVQYLKQCTNILHSL